jgi:6-phosphogluconolactonase (cycloisomerase 2 family)
MNRDGKFLYVLNQFSETVSAYAVDPVSGQLSELPGSPFGGAGSSNSMVVDPSGKRLYAGNATTITGYKLFDNRGTLHLLKESPFAGVSDAFGLSLDLSGSFLYAANHGANTISGFQVDQKTGNLSSLSDSPYSAGTNPTSVVVVSDFK